MWVWALGMHSLFIRSFKMKLIIGGVVWWRGGGRQHVGLGFGRAGSRAARRSVEQEGGGRLEIRQLYEAKNLTEISQEARNLRKN